jgi:hypothetical protein
MKKSLRILLTSAVLMTAGTMNMFATMGGTNPHPQPTSSASVSDVVVVILNVLGL